MRNVIRIFAVPLGFAALQACTAPQATVVPPPMPPSVPTTSGGTVPVPAEIRTAHAGYIAAWNGEDPAAVGAFFTDDVHGVIGGDVLHGRATLVSEWVTPNLPQLSDLSVIPESFTPGGDNQVTEVGRYRFRAASSGAVPMMVGGTYTNVWTRQPDGSWRISATTAGDAEPI
ncbi:MAG TPA: nuclear transport factor 2 family protein [Longimicrobium sp.]|nr:nuclear transport factor 2 family protein [Longimicrobium sp.]